MPNIKIALDAMGGDYAPKSVVDGALIELERHEDLELVLVGREEAIRKELEGKTYDEARLTIVHRDQVVENEEHNPAEAARRKRDSSMMTVMTMVRKKEVDGCVSAGNTGAVLAGATLLVGRVPGVLRPALSVGFPGRTSTTYMLDVGANMDAKPQYLVQFAEMTSIFCRKQLGIESPKVGLLNVGVEPGKGNALVKETYDLLSADPEINFIGNVEAREVFETEADVLVTDGFAGNVLLKGIEGTAAYILNVVKDEIMSSFRYKMGGLLIKPAMKNVKEKLDPRNVGGTPLLGINGAVVKAHGNSKGKSFASAIEQCLIFLKSDINTEIRETLARRKEAEAGKEEA